jgi:hypothetical protein
MLAVNHYEKDGDVRLFIANQDSTRRRDLAVRAQWPTEKVELWDPMQGTVEKPVVENGFVKLALEPSQAVFLVWPSGALGDRALPRVEMPQGEVVAVTVKEAVTPVAVEGSKEGAIASAHPFGPLVYAKWIWHPVNSTAKGKVKFSARIVSDAVQEATMTFTCDNAAVVSVNGRKVAEQAAGNAPEYSGWRTPTVVTFVLKEGVNVIEVMADNAEPGPAGFVASVRWPFGLLLTDAEDWRVSREGESEVKPRALCRFGSGKWGKFGPVGNVTESPFAESVATSLTFTLPELKDGARVYFVCDGTEGENSAAVTVNGTYAGGFIGAPYRLDITKSVKSGSNTLEAKPFRLANPKIVVVE